MSDVTIYHNPACGTSRKTLELLRERGIEPRVVEYLKVGWTTDLLKDLVRQTGGQLIDLVRERGTRAEELGLLDPSTSDDVRLEAMVADPVLVNRPIVVTTKGTALCRPQERVLDLL